MRRRAEFGQRNATKYRFAAVHYGSFKRGNHSVLFLILRPKLKESLSTRSSAKSSTVVVTLHQSSIKLCFISRSAICLLESNKAVIMQCNIFKPILSSALRPRNMKAMYGHIFYSVFPGVSSRTYNTKSKYQISRYADLRGPLRNPLLRICAILFVFGLLYILK